MVISQNFQGVMGNHGLIHSYFRGATRKYPTFPSGNVEKIVSKGLKTDTSSMGGGGVWTLNGMAPWPIE